VDGRPCGRNPNCSALSLASKSGLAYAEVYIHVMAHNFGFPCNGVPCYPEYEKINELEDGLYCLYFYSGHLVLSKTTVSLFEYLFSLTTVE
jgi:hypothetical protein